MCGADVVNEAVEAAAAAFPAWRETPPVERARVFFRYRQLIEENFDRICQSVSREHGKTLAEARGSVYRGIENIEYACGVPSLLMGDTLENLARGVDCETMLQPLGVCVGITPFNFPAMVPLWMFPLALACGNTFVLKPSEKVPLTAVLLVELLEKAGLPKGVLNIVHGGRECVDALLTHPKVQRDLVCRLDAGREIHLRNRHAPRQTRPGERRREELHRHHARCGRAEHASRRSRPRRSAARANAAWRARPRSPSARRRNVCCRRWSTRRARSKSARPIAEAQPDMGPVITAQHRDRVLGLVASGEKEGARVIADGRGVKVADAPNGFYLGATDRRSACRTSMTLAREEVFGPVLNVMRMDDLDRAIEMANTSAFGNGAAIFTNSGKAAREFKHRVKAGMVGINVGVPATMAMFPFTGWDESFFGDLHIQGREGVQFYTQQKVVTTRWFGDGVGDVWKKWHD